MGLAALGEQCRGVPVRSVQSGGHDADDPGHGPAGLLGSLASAHFPGSLCCGGLDPLPDVFHPVGADRSTQAVTAVLTASRRTDLPKAGTSGTVAIRGCENGWPTGRGRPEQRQAAVLGTVARTVAGLATGLDTDGYSPFVLRDADSRAEDPFHHFGLLRDDHTPSRFSIPTADSSTSRAIRRSPLSGDVPPR